MALSLNRQNWFKISVLIVDFGAKTLRNIWKSEWKAVTGHDWVDATDGNYIFSKEIKNGFVARELHNNQPAAVKSGHVEDWDITLLCTLLLNSTILNLYKRRNASNRIYNIYEFIRALRNERNTIYGHCSSTELKPSEYAYYYRTIVNLFKTIGIDESECQREIAAHFASQQSVDELLSRESEYKAVMQKFRDRSFRLLQWLKDHCWDIDEIGYLDVNHATQDASSSEGGIPSRILERVAKKITAGCFYTPKYNSPRLVLSIMPEGLLVPALCPEKGT
jgi:hypothetical protein